MRFSASVKDVRKAFGILACPLSNGDQILRHFAYMVQAQPFQSTSLFATTGFAVLTLRRSQVDLTEMFHNHIGAKRIWFVIPPGEMEKFENKVMEMCSLNNNPKVPYCAQIVGHQMLWLDPEKVRSWGFTVLEAHQSAGQMVIIQPRSYYWGWVQGFGVTEHKYIAGPELDCENFHFCRKGGVYCGEDDRKDGATLQPTEKSMRKFRALCAELEAEAESLAAKDSEQKDEVMPNNQSIHPEEDRSPKKRKIGDESVDQLDSPSAEHVPMNPIRKMKEDMAAKEIAHAQQLREKEEQMSKLAEAHTQAMQEKDEELREKDKELLAARETAKNVAKENERLLEMIARARENVVGMFDEMMQIK